jgi:hypothetical protein
MTEFNFYAAGDSVTLRAELRDEAGNLVDADSTSVSVRKARSVQYKDWAGAVEYLAPTTMENLELGSYRYSWDTTGRLPGKYVAQLTAIRGGVTNIERLLITLK